jgi:hypothetical protein
MSEHEPTVIKHADSGLLLVPKHQYDALRAELTSLREEHEQMLDAATHGQLGEWLLAERTRLNAEHTNNDYHALVAANDALVAENAEQARRIVELEEAALCACGDQFNPDFRGVCPCCLSAQEASKDQRLAAQDAAILALHKGLEKLAAPLGSGCGCGGVCVCFSPEAMREALENPYEPVRCYGCVPDGEGLAECPGHPIGEWVLHNTAPAAQETERRIREDERSKVEDRVFASGFADLTGPRQDAVLRAAILGTDQPTQPQG